MQDVMGIVLTENNDVKLSGLTTYRALAAVPVVGRYRIIDFVLSNMANSDVQHIGVTTQYNYRSLMYHLGAGKQWNLNRKNGGLFVLPPYVISENVGLSKGVISTIYGIMGYIATGKQKYVAISSSNVICNIDYGKVLDFHESNGADITVVYMNDETYTPESLSRNVLLKVDDSNRVKEIEVLPMRPKNKNISMGIYIMERTLLEHLVEDCISHGEHDFVMDILLKNLDEFKILGYEHKGYCRIIDDIKTYFNFNMELLEGEVRRELFNPVRKIYTSVKDTFSTKYADGAVVKNCLVADGCLVEGNIENCILSRGVRIKKGSELKNCIVMQDTEVGRDCRLEYVVLDKEVKVRTGVQLIGQKNFPVVIEKRRTV